MNEQTLHAFYDELEKISAHPGYVHITLQKPSAELLKSLGLMAAGAAGYQAVRTASKDYQRGKQMRRMGQY